MMTETLLCAGALSQASATFNKQPLS